jgi:ribosome biogenesis GTPase A
MGVVGLPNVGKSTFFNILTKLQAAGKNINNKHIYIYIYFKINNI